MLAYIIRRTLFVIPVVLGVALVVFILFNVVGWNAASQMLGGGLNLLCFVGNRLPNFIDKRGLAYGNPISGPGTVGPSIPDPSFWITLNPQPQPNPPSFPPKPSGQSAGPEIVTVSIPGKPCGVASELNEGFVQALYQTTTVKIVGQVPGGDVDEGEINYLPGGSHWQALKDDTEPTTPCRVKNKCTATCCDKDLGWTWRVSWDDYIKGVVSSVLDPQGSHTVNPLDKTYKDARCILPLPEEQAGKEQCKKAAKAKCDLKFDVRK